MPEMTPRQQAIYEFIVSTVEEHGYQPSYREICEHLGLRSLNAVRHHLEAMEKKGLIYLPRHVAGQQARAIGLIGMRFQRVESSMELSRIPTTPFH